MREGDSSGRVFITIGQIILFSTETGDASLLDPSDVDLSAALETWAYGDLPVCFLQQPARFEWHRTKVVVLTSKRHDRTEDDPNRAVGSSVMWWVNFRRGSELIGAAIIEAPIIYHARMQLALRGIGRTANYSEGKEVDAERAALIPRDLIGRLLLPDEAQKIRLLSPDEAQKPVQPSAGDPVEIGHLELEGTSDAGL